MTIIWEDLQRNNPFNPNNKRWWSGSNSFLELQFSIPTRFTFSWNQILVWFFSRQDIKVNCMKLEQKIWDSRREKCKGLNFLIFPRFFFGDASITRTRLWNIFDKFHKKNAKRKRLLLVLLATKNTRKGKEVREKSFAKQLVELWPRIPEKHRKTSAEMHL